MLLKCLWEIECKDTMKRVSTLDSWLMSNWCFIEQYHIRVLGLSLLFGDGNCFCCAFWWTFHWMQKLLNVQFKRQLLQTLECGSTEYVSSVGMSNTTDAFEHSFRFCINCWTREKKTKYFIGLRVFSSLRVCARSDGC